MCVCVSVKSHLTSGASVHRENAATYSAGNESQKICGVFSENVELQRSSATSLAIHRIGHFSYREHACALWIRQFDKTVRDVIWNAVLDKISYIIAGQRSRRYRVEADNQEDTQL